MPLANDDASAAARGRHVGSVGVGATRSSSNSSTYVADQRHSPPAGHPRAREREITLLLPLTTRPGTYTRHAATQHTAPAAAPAG